MGKGGREAKINTSWISPNTPYEEALIHFTDTILSNTPDNPFLKDFEPFQKRVSGYGMYNSLSQTLLKITSPGVPDFYQGTEIWDFSLVDPDNRRPVNYGTRMMVRKDIEERESDLPLPELVRELTI